MANRFDYIVVGGGSAGCVVAARLAESGRHSVLLIEAGRSDVGDPKALHLSRLGDQDKSYDWGYEAEPVAGSGGRIDYARARILGGCANHNDCAFIAPPPSDFVRWEELGAKGWGPDAMAPVLAKIEQSTGIEASPPGNVLSRAFIDAAAELGLPEINFREKVTAGAGWFPLNAQGDLRQSSSIAYIHPLLGVVKNLRVLTDTLATRLIFEGRRAIGVETDRGTFRTGREVILCGGSINTPQLLMLSGIGPAAHLRDYGITVRADAPGIGSNLIDHVAANVTYELKLETPRWERTPCESTVLLKVDESAPAPDVLFHFVLRLREKYVGRTMFAGVTHGVKLSPNVARPKSRGSLSLSGSNLQDKPVIALNYFSDGDGYDRRILLAGLRFARRLAGTAAVAPWIGREITPGPATQDDDELFAYVRETCETVYHPCGTCRMGAAADAMTVVTPDLRVKGFEDLRIADASVFPDMITVNINNAVMMVAERAAELLIDVA